MSRETLLIVIGLLIAVAPFLGLPYSWLMVLLPVLGLITAGLAVMIRGRRTPTIHEESSDA